MKNVSFKSFNIEDDNQSVLFQKINIKKEYFILDRLYLMSLINHDFTEIKMQSIFKKKILVMMKEIMSMEQKQANENKSELTISHLFFAKKMHESNYKIAIDFLFEIGFMRKKFISREENGKMKYYQRPQNGEAGVVTTYIITPVSDYQTDFALIELDTKTKKTTKNFKVKLSKKEEDTLINTVINKKAAIKAEFSNFKITKNINSLYKRINRILTFGETVYTTRGNKSQRIFHNLSNLSRVSRKFISFDNQAFNNYDLKNSQPLFFLIYCNKNGLILDEQFINDVQNGTLYNRFYSVDESLFNADISTLRANVKVEFFRTIFFAFQMKEKFNIEFKNIYPLAWQILRDINKQYKKDDKINLSILLQNEEHNAFQNIVLKSDAYFNLFDSIYCSDESDLFLVELHMNQYMKANGIDKFQFTINE